MYQFLLLIAIVFATIYCQEHSRAVIMSGPEHQIAAPHDKISFNCIAQGEFVFWLIDKRCPCNETDKAKFEERGFHFSQEGEHNKTITIEATLANNGTIISCTTLKESGRNIISHAFQEGSLIIAGPPLAPSVHLNVRHISNDTFTFTLNWSTAFTWSGFPIISYKITMTNSSDEQPKTTVNATKSSVNHIEYTGSGSGCHTLTFSIEANNSIGRGESTFIQSAQPIAIDDIRDIEISFGSLINREPHFWISFHAPMICTGYQTGTYNMSIYDSDGAIVDHFGPMKYTQQNNSERVLVIKRLRSGLMLGNQYEVNVTVESLGVVRSRRKNFSTKQKLQCHYFTLCDYAYAVYPLDNDHNVYPGTFADHLPCLVNQGGNKVITIGTSIGAVFLIFTFILLVVIFMVVCRHKRKIPELNETDNGALPRRRRVRVPSHKMEANPIYEGVMYETTPGESFKPLLNNPSKVETDHDPHCKACPGRSPPISEEVRYCGVHISNEMNPTVTITDTNIQARSDGALIMIHKRESDSDDHVAKDPGNSSSLVNEQVPYDDFEEEVYATLT